MILVRYTFQAKWGKAGEIAEEFAKNAEMMSQMVGSKVRGRILTDLSGPFDTVVQELEVESLAELEKLRATMFANQEYQEARAALSESQFESGRAEFYTIESSF